MAFKSQVIKYIRKTLKNHSDFLSKTAGLTLESNELYEKTKEFFFTAPIFIIYEPESPRRFGGAPHTP